MITKKIHAFILTVSACTAVFSFVSCKELSSEFLDDPTALHVEVCDESGINTSEAGTQPVKGRFYGEQLDVVFSEGKWHCLTRPACS